MRLIVTLTTIGTVALIVRHYRILLVYMKVRGIIRQTGMMSVMIFDRDFAVNWPSKILDT